MCGADLKLLTISGEPTKEELEQAWKDITDDYSEAIKTPKSKSLFECHRKCVYTYWKLTLAEATLLKFKMIGPDGAYLYDAKEAEDLMLMGYDLIDPPTDLEVYMNQINMVDMETRTLVVLLAQYQNEYKLLAGDSDGDAAVARTEADFDKELALLSKFMNQWVDKKLRTVSEICSIINAFIETNNAS